MSGISGILHFDQTRPVSQSTLKRMLECLKHRGPDGQGFYAKNNIGLAHQRLAIIDITTGSQPMFNNDQSIGIVFDGEIYNYVEVREELKSLGHLFVTDSDTEVLIRAYEQWGADLHEKLNGVWAFAIWDERKKHLFLSRDRLGAKPLVYAVLKDTFLFASEIKSIEAYGIPREANLEVLEIYLALGRIPAPFTFFKNIQKLRAGRYLVVKDGQVYEHSYWGLPDASEMGMIEDQHEVHERFESLFHDSVKLRMGGDVSIGAFLSGGLDSSSVVAVMSEISHLPVKTFTIAFHEKGFGEQNKAREVANRFKTDHHEYAVQADSLEKSLEDILHFYDEPYGDSSAIPTLYASACASKEGKVVLGGDGGDELLSGYNGFQTEKFAEMYQRFPRGLQGIGPICIGLMSKIIWGPFYFRLRQLQRVLSMSRLGFQDRLLLRAPRIDLGSLKELVRPLSGQTIPIEQYLADLMKQCPYRDNFYRLMYYMLLRLDSGLAKVERMTMANSIEVRLPFIDHRLVEFMVRVHKNINMRGYQRKSVLRHTIGKRLPRAILRAHKKGFVPPTREWFRQKALTDALKDILVASGLALNLDVVETVIQQNHTGEADFGNFLWMLYLLGRWFKG